MTLRSTPLDGASWRPEELVWAPDASAFVINGSESAIAGFDFVVFDIERVPIAPVRISAAAQRDMIATYPECEARNLEPDDCRRIECKSEFNMSAIAWTRAAKAVVVFAEVPCSSTYGGIMCQVMGYELEVATGRILARMGGLVRMFFPGMPSSWSSIRSQVGDTPLLVSFHVSPQQILSGRYDSQLRTWFAAAPRDHGTRWAYYHEPEDDGVDASAYRQAWRHINALANRPTTSGFAPR